MRFSPKRTEFGPCPNCSYPTGRTSAAFRNVARVFSGSFPTTSPFSWSVVVITQRPQGFTTRNMASPTRIFAHSSSAKGSLPFTTKLGRNRFIGIWNAGALPASARLLRPILRFNSSNEPSPISSSPCMAPQIAKFQPAPCQMPPSSMVTMRLTYTLGTLARFPPSGM